VARGFGGSVRTVRRYQERYADGGMAALSREKEWRRGRRRISSKRLRTIEILEKPGHEQPCDRAPAGVTETAVRKLVGPSKCDEDAQLALPAIPAAATTEFDGPSRQ